jgi:hypothetical protein
MFLLRSGKLKQPFRGACVLWCLLVAELCVR